MTISRSNVSTSQAQGQAQQIRHVLGGIGSNEGSSRDILSLLAKLWCMADRTF